MSGQEDKPLTSQEAAQLLFSFLAPGMIAEAKKVKLGESDLVHYTTADNAIKIIRNKEFWLRSVRTMNDFMEVQHGINLLLKAFGGPDNERVERLCKALDQISPGSARAGIDSFNEWLPRLPDITFIGCLSQAEPDETYGRLSMWRGYSAPAVGVCIVMEKTPFIAESDNLKAYSLPVAYLTDADFLSGIDQCIALIENSIQLLQNVEGDQIAATIFWWLLSMSVSLKHPGFNEEREWRIIYYPEIARSDDISEVVETIRGVPQIVQKIPLKDDPDAGLHGAAPASLVKKLIVGPTEYAGVVMDALATELRNAGVDDAESKISLSDIPLR